MQIDFSMLATGTAADPRKRHTLVGRFRFHPNFHSKHLPSNRNVIVYLPPGYERARKKRYPVFYLHDGQNLFDGATSFIPGKEWRIDETAQRLIRARTIEPVIIVGIYNTGTERADEYTPTRDQKRNIGGRADDYGRMIVEELKPFIDSNYLTLTDRANTALGGSSLGGLVTLYLGLRHADVFGKLAALSPSVWWDDRFIVREVLSLGSKPDARIWIDMGTGEGSSLDDVLMLRDALIEKGWVIDLDLKFFEAKGARHDEQAWGERVEPVLRFLFPAKKK